MYEEKSEDYHGLTRAIIRTCILQLSFNLRLSSMYDCTMYRQLRLCVVTNAFLSLNTFIGSYSLIKCLHEYRYSGVSLYVLFFFSKQNICAIKMSKKQSIILNKRLALSVQKGFKVLFN